MASPSLYNPFSRPLTAPVTTQATPAAQSQPHGPTGRDLRQALDAPFGRYPPPQRRGWLPVWLERRGAPGPAVVDAVCDGLRLRLDGPATALRADKMLPGLRPLLSALLEDLPGGGAAAAQTAVDVGAGCGLFTLAACRHLDARARVVAIEGDATLNRHLMANLSFNAVTATVDVLDRPGPGAGTLVDLLHHAGLARVDLMRVCAEGPRAALLPTFLATAPAALRPRWLVVDRGAWAYDVDDLAALWGYRLRAELSMLRVWGAP